MANAPEKMAWISTPEVTFAVRAPADSSRSPIRELIERIYAVESISRARALLRARVHANYAATPVERETVKVAAKRISAPSPESVPLEAIELPAAGSVDCRLDGFSPGVRIPRSEIRARLERLKRETRQGTERWISDRAVAALLVDAEDRLLAIGWNTNATVRTRHAEWNLCDSVAASPAGKIPIGAKLYVTLKPCRMCAARIWEAATDPAHLVVFYLENDPGPHARATLLDPASTARRRYLGADHPLFALELSRLDPLTTE